MKTKVSKSKIVRESFAVDHSLLSLSSKQVARRIGRGVTVQTVDNIKSEFRKNGQTAPNAHEPKGINASAMIRDMVSKEPSITPDNVLLGLAKHKIKCTRNLVTRLIREVKLGNGTWQVKHEPVPVQAKPIKGEEFACAIQIPVAGATIKLSTKAKGMIGTLGVSQEGFTFIKAKAKKPTGRNLSWDRLAKLFESGLI